MRYLLAMIIQVLLTLVALAISLTFCVFFNLAVHPISLAITLTMVLMLIIYGGTDAGKLLQDK
ncbi:hypothetical protein ETI05_03620 [Macrococcoides canis]|uniref:hypothetical protein n=1 Tax=Macrococcoides canis TaxID=1855823 RepID=UPI00105E9571|nr:hypothetical protein [Macrococcus canis]TDM21844.1 hypothetical protein ETI05_03620 [Macrococcus canis]